MRFPSSLKLGSRCISISRTARSMALGALALAMFALGGGCEDKHVGRPCELGTTPTGGSSGQVAILASPALECPSRICLLPVNEKGATTGPLCTAACESNDDCSDGETGDSSNPADLRCKTGFACTWPTTVGDFRCQRLCVCRDFVYEPPGGFQQPKDCQ